MKEALKVNNSTEEIIEVLKYGYQQGIERENISMMELVNEMKEKLQIVLK